MFGLFGMYKYVYVDTCLVSLTLYRQGQDNFLTLKKEEITIKDEKKQNFLLNRNSVNTTKYGHISNDQASFSKVNNNF